MASVPQTKIRMDRAKTFATVHGERTPGDKHLNVHFYQDGLPFDAHGLSVPDAIDPSDEKLLALHDRRLKKMSVGRKPEADIEADADADASDTGAGEETGSGDDSNEVNLEAWLRGEARYQWFTVKAAIRATKSANLNTQAEAVEFLVRDEKIVAEADLSPQMRALLPK